MFSLRDLYLPWTSLVVWWLRLHAPNPGGPGLIPVQGTRSHVPKQGVLMVQLKGPTCHKEDQRSRGLQLKPGTAR